MSINSARDHFVYRLFDNAGVLIYVGCSSNVGARLRAHRNNQPWGDEIASCTSDGPYTHLGGLSREASVIRCERPRYNVVHNPAAPKPWRPAEGAIDVVQRYACLARACIIRAMWAGELSTDPTDDEARAWAASLDLRYQRGPDDPTAFDPGSTASRNRPN